MRMLFAAVLRDKEGVTSIEYAVIAAMISVAIIVAITNVGSNLFHIYDHIGDLLGPQRAGG